MDMQGTSSRDSWAVEVAVLGDPPTDSGGGSGGNLPQPGGNGESGGGEQQSQVDYEALRQRKLQMEAEYDAQQRSKKIRTALLIGGGVLLVGTMATGIVLLASQNEKE